MAWYVAEFAVPDEIGEAAAEVLKAHGADGVAEEWRQEQHFVRGFWCDAAEEQVAAVTELALRQLVEVGLLDAIPPVTLTTMEDRDWLEGWKQYFSPQEVSPRLAITPSWESFTPRPGQAVVVLDPGMAFGTGTHGTTFTCLQALSYYLTPGMRVCDVGAGSGILAIAAIKLGAGAVTAIDNDPLAVRVAQENADLNHVRALIDFHVAELLATEHGRYDLIIANILAPVIIALIPQLPPVLEPGGLFISSGYLVSQEDDIRAALRAAGHAILARYEREGWVTLVSRGG